MKTFHEAKLPAALIKRLDSIGFTTPTPIQAEAIPAALQGKDVLGSAQTGTGKTGAFGIPLVAHLTASPHGTALILLPTRELADQVLKTLETFIDRNAGISTALLIGGEPMPKQFKQLRNNPRLIVGTPGRINDHLKRKTLKLEKTDFLVLDEVDRMLDMGFGVQLDEIAKYLTAKRQTLMFTATMPKNLEKIAAKYLTDPTRISIGGLHNVAENLKQTNIKVKTDEKHDRLLQELDERTGSVIIFVKTKRGADRMAIQLNKLKHKAEALHGDLRQSKRDRVIGDYRKEKFRILVATDVAARGLDIPHIEHVINYDLPQAPEDFIHRIGRTARADAKGEALNFICPNENGKWKAIQRLLDPDAKQTEDRAPRGDRNRGQTHNRRRTSNGSRGNYKPREGSDRPRRSFDKNESTGDRKPRSTTDKIRGFFEKKESTGDRKPRESGFDKPRRPFKRSESDGDRKPRSAYDATNKSHRSFDKSESAGDRKPRSTTDKIRGFFGKKETTGDRKPREAGFDKPRRPFKRSESAEDRKPRASYNATKKPRFNTDAKSKDRKKPYKAYASKNN
ncbi:MAG: DEAD/DEAH box helicase [Alphaproteobacteria bacterium]|nr:DEAD/DEAH box helicase [Alphaproteobacteria bacterium]MBN2779725.1 DEAD/DEAH box helicase [Alphaproteobacteria bacterium]